MKKIEAEKELENLLGYSINQNGEKSIGYFAYNYDDLVEWCEPLDESFILVDEEVDIDGFKMILYGVDNDDRDVTAFIVLMENDEVFSYGYSGD